MTITERPILMSEPMVLATLDDRKTQTRRICAPADMNAGLPRAIRRSLDYQPCWAAAVHPARESGWIAWHPNDPGEVFTRDVYAEGFRCPHGRVGDRLWVRETVAYVPATAYRGSGVPHAVNPSDPDEWAIYRAGWDRNRPGARWRPSIHMHRWAARLILEITDVRVERLQDISEADAISEGIARDPYQRWHGTGYKTAGAAFAALWDGLNAARGYGWARNPWVWAITFRKAA